MEGQNDSGAILVRSSKCEFDKLVGKTLVIRWLLAACAV